MLSVISLIARSNARMRSQRQQGGLPLALVLLALLVAAPLLPVSLGWLTADEAVAASAYSPRSSGMDMPGEAKRLETLPSKNAGRTAEGGMGYTDAYGNTVTEAQPEEKSPRRRPRPGAYGHRPMQEHDRPLPDPGKSDDAPAWNFN